MIYLDNAATTRTKPPAVAQAVLEALSACGSCGRGAHEGALSAARTVYGTREKIAALLGCPRADHVCFTQNSTQALNIAISGLLGPGDHVISTDLEHNSVLRPLCRLRERGTAVDFVPADGRGRLDYGGFERLLRPETKAVACTHASNLTGDVVDIQRVGRFAREHGLLFILDASQTAGVLPIDMTAMGVSVVCFTGHKGLMGPQGTGGLCVQEGLDIRPFAVGGTGVQSYSETQPEEYPTRLEAGMENGYETEVNERGSRLSAGQRQLISFARALLADPKILILDEATSSIDTETELILQKGLQELLKGRTSFIIAHRLSTIKNADCIMYVDKGAILERGTHEELLARKGEYYRLYMSQFDFLKTAKVCV